MQWLIRISSHLAVGPAGTRWGDYIALRSSNWISGRVWEGHEGRDEEKREGLGRDKMEDGYYLQISVRHSVNSFFFQPQKATWWPG